jgi:hypothetical protein
MLKTLAAALAILGAVAVPAAADRGQPSTSMTLTAKLGTDYDLHRRDHKKELPKDADAAKVTKALTIAQIAAVAKVRHEEVAYCWDRLPPSQRIAGTAVLRFSVEPTGKVAEIAVSGDAPDAATSCLADAARSWVFPATDAKSELEYPIRLR